MVGSAADLLEVAHLVAGAALTAAGILAHRAAGSAGCLLLLFCHSFGDVLASAELLLLILFKCEHFGGLVILLALERMLPLNILCLDRHVVSTVLVLEARPLLLSSIVGGSKPLLGGTSHAFGALTAVSRVAQTLAFFDLLVDESGPFFVIELLFEGGHAELLVGWSIGPGVVDYSSGVALRMVVLLLQRVDGVCAPVVLVVPLCMKN